MDFKTYFLLRGDNEHLAEGELKALLEIYDPGAVLQCYTMVCASTTRVEVALRIAKRAGYVKEVGELIGIYDAYSREGAREAAAAIGGGVVHVSVPKSTVSANAVKEFVEGAGLKRGFGGLGEKRFIFSGGLVFAGLKRYLQDTKAIIKRGREKPFERSLAITPLLARVLVNLSRAREGSLLLDPFAGTGSILIEAWYMGIRGIGVDLDQGVLVGMVRNLRHFGVHSIVILGDSREIPYRSIDHVATDLPYGRGASTHGVEIKGLYRDFMDKLDEYLSRKGYTSFMAPIWLEEYVDELISTHNLKLVGRYYDYVHGGLTRVINVVKRHG